jgi:hypothetical protein
MRSWGSALLVNPGFGLLVLLLQVANLAVETAADVALPALLAHYPGPIDPRRAMTHVLVVAALELRHPMSLFVSMKSQNLSLHDAWGILLLPLYLRIPAPVGAPPQVEAAAFRQHKTGARHMSPQGVTRRILQKNCKLSRDCCRSPRDQQEQALAGRAFWAQRPTTRPTQGSRQTAPRTGWSPVSHTSAGAAKPKRGQRQVQR